MPSITSHYLHLKKIGLAGLTCSLLLLIQCTERPATHSSKPVEPISTENLNPFNGDWITKKRLGKYAGEWNSCAESFERLAPEGKTAFYARRPFVETAPTQWYIENDRLYLEIKLGRGDNSEFKYETYQILSDDELLLLDIYPSDEAINQILPMRFKRIKCPF